MQWRSYENIQLENTKNLILLEKGTLIKFLFSNTIGFLIEEASLSQSMINNPVKVYIDNKIMNISRDKIKYYL